MEKPVFGVAFLGVPLARKRKGKMKRTCVCSIARSFSCPSWCTYINGQQRCLLKNVCEAMPALAPRSRSGGCAHSRSMPYCYALLDQDLEQCCVEECSNLLHVLGSGTSPHCHPCCCTHQCAACACSVHSSPAFYPSSAPPLPTPTSRFGAWQLLM